MISTLLLLLIGRCFCHRTKPNIILTIADGVGWGDIGANNLLNPHTPNIDQLAASGINYQDYHIGGGTASASMAALLTGRHGQRNGVREGFTAFSAGGLPSSEKTIADYLQDIGYVTGYIGVWDLGHQTEFLPLSRGFDYFYGTPFDPVKGCVYMNTMQVPRGVDLSCTYETAPVPLMENNTILEQPLNMDNLSNEVLYAKANNFVYNAVKQDKPFLLIISVTTIKIPLFTVDEPLANKESLLNKLDETVAMSQNMLLKYGLTHITISIFTSKTSPDDTMCNLSGDVGPYRGEWQRLHYPDTSPTMGTNWEGATRVPFVISWPHGIPPVYKNNRLTSAVDLVKTLSDVTGFALPDDRVFDGVSLEADFSSEESDKNVSRVLYFLETDSDKVMVFRVNELKVYYRTSGARKCNSAHYPIGEYANHFDQPLVFNLTSDPGELHSLAYDNTLFASLQEYIENGEAMFSFGSGLKSLADYSESDSAVLCCNDRCSCHAPWDSEPTETIKVVVNDLYVDRTIVPIYGVMFICFLVLLATAFVLHKSYVLYTNHYKTYCGYDPVLDKTELWFLSARKG